MNGTSPTEAVKFPGRLAMKTDVLDRSGSVGSKLKLETTPLAVTFGARLHNVDLRNPPSAALAQAMREALDEHKVLVIDPPEIISPRQLVAFSEVFGTPESVEHPTEPSHPDHP